MVEPTTQKYSLKGYNFKEWLKGTKDTFKLFLTAGVGVATYYVTSRGFSPELVAVLSTASLALSKWLIDLVDYWLSE